MLEQLKDQMSAPLQSVKERAMGITYHQRMPPIGGWTLPRTVEALTAEQGSGRADIAVILLAHEITPLYSCCGFYTFYLYVYSFLSVCL